MANEVYANNMEVSCKAAAGKSICSFPDVCFTPPQTPATPPGVPIPYPNTGLASDCTDGSRSVRISNQEVMLKNKSYFKKSTGDEAGSAPKKGLITSTNRGKIFFVAWSMDVKAEGENVVRHMDMTTHNHGSNANQPAPWLYADTLAQAPGGACNKAPGKDYVAQTKKNCEPDKWHSKACCDCDGRKCMMVPGDLSKKYCCKKGGKHQTPHHVVPAADHYTKPGIRLKIDKNKMTQGQARRYMRDGNKNYDQKAAPCICAQGNDHRVKSQHGKIGRAITHLRNLIPGKTYKYEQLAPGAAKIVAAHTGCDADCIKAQMDNYHSTNSSGDLTKSVQAKKGGHKPFKTAIPDESTAFAPL